MVRWSNGGMVGGGDAGSADVLVGSVRFVPFVLSVVSVLYPPPVKTDGWRGTKSACADSGCSTGSLPISVGCMRGLDMESTAAILYTRLTYKSWEKPLAA